MNIGVVAAQWKEAATQTHHELTMVQKVAYDELIAYWNASPITVLHGATGYGKTMILERFAQENDARIVNLSDVAAMIAPLDGLWYTGPLLEYLQDALANAETLILDGVQHFLNAVLPEHSHVHMHVYMVIEALYRDAERLGKKLIVSGALPNPGWTIHHFFRRHDLPAVEIQPFMHEDYQQIISARLGADRVSGIQFQQLFRFASLLNGYDLSTIAGIVDDIPMPSTQDCVDAIQEFIVSANLDIHEVEDVRFETMPGMEDLAAALETHVVTPLTDMALAEELDLRAKRGVLLYGPPGTGKTSVGRALAHRLKGRFFLIDGSVRTEPAYAFINRLQMILKEAIENAPSVVFIDDADVLFDVAHVGGLTRFLLTLMDGLAGANSSKVCVMMTAMDAGKIPQAILRSGRVELWLQTRLPDSSTRADIMRRWLGDRIPAFDGTDFEALGSLTNNFTPADLRRVIADAKALYAMDRVHGRHILNGTGYVERAIADIVASRATMAANLADPSLRLG
jgi:transitional endoplasmic reticulum ATPase